MALPRQKFREIVFQILFCLDLSKGYSAEMLPFFMACFKITKKYVMQGLEKALAIYEKKSELDQIIQKNVQGYELERISKVERNILRLSIFELQEEGISNSIMIAEGIRLCRKFGSIDSARFIHALLDAVIKENVVHSER